MSAPPVAKRPKLSVDSELNASDNEPTRTWKTVSHFERLPREIMHKIIDLVPDSVATVLTLRKTSLTMKANADTYAKMLRIIQPIHKLKLSGLEYKRVPGKSSTPFVITVFVAKPSALLMLKLIALQSTDNNFSNRFEIFMSLSLERNPCSYITEVAFKLFEDDERSSDTLRICLMTSIKEVQLVEFEGEKKWNFVHKLLERTKISVIC